jgi:DNA damage-binding protein 1
LEVRQIQSNKDGNGTDLFPVVLQLPINGRLIALNALTLPNVPTAALFLLHDRYQYAVITYNDKPQTPPKTPSQRNKVTAYPVYTHSSGSLETANISRPNEGGTIVAVDPYNRCIAVHAFDGLITIIPIDLNYQPSSNAKVDSGSNRVNARRPKQLLGTPFHCRIEESTILSISFLYMTVESNEPPPIQIAVLYQDSRGSQHLTTHVINLQRQQIHLYGSQSAPTSVQWLKKSMLDGGSSMLIPVKLPTTTTSTTTVQNSTGSMEARQVVTNSEIQPKNSPAVVVIGQRQFTYCSITITKTLPVPQTLFLAYTELPNDPNTDMPRYLLADEMSTLYLLSIVAVQNRVVAMQLEALGSTTLASSLNYLNEGLLYVGSTLGDSQLIQIHDDPIVHPTNGDDANNYVPENSGALMDTTYLSVIEEYTNLGPILDFDLVPTNPQSGPQPQLTQSQVVTASGTSSLGSLRVVRNGIGMYEYASVEIPGIQAMWSLRKTFDSSDDSYLVQSFVGETRVLGVVVGSSDDAMEDTADGEYDEGAIGGTLEEVVLPGLDSSASTLYVGNIVEGDRFLQITGTEIRLFERSGDLVCTWNHQITIATANEAGQIAVSVQGGLMVYLQVFGDSIKKIHEKTLENEVSCIDIHPFSPNDIDGNMDAAMEIDDSRSLHRKAYMSTVIAVGLWDDFTVRLLSINDSLQELVCINLGITDEDDEIDDQSGSMISRQNRNNMMARSLSLVTLYFSSQSSTSKNRNSSNYGVNMLFVGMGDGTLISYAVVLVNDVLTVQSKKEVCFGTQRIDLVQLTTVHGGTCILATGDRPTVIYLAGIVGSGTQITPKLCYSTVNVESSEDDFTEQQGSFINKQKNAVNIATPFFSPLLFNNTSLGKQQYSLCVSDDSRLKLGVIDDIQKLHVTTCRLGMAPRRVVHCPDGRIFAVGCIESGNHSHGFSGDEVNMGNCIRFMDETTFDDLEQIQLEPFEMILSMLYTRLGVPVSGNDSTDGPTNTKAELIYKSFLLVGTAYAFPDEDEPTRGRVLVYSCQPDDSSNATSITSRPIRQVTEMLTEGGVYSICQFYDGKMLMTVNSRTYVCEMVEEVGLLRLQYVGLGHFGHILSLFVKSRAQYKSNYTGKSEVVRKLLIHDSSTGESSSEHETKEPEEMLAIVGDLMRSISLVQFYPQHHTLEEIARDFNANWTCAVEMLNDNIYLGAENWNNFFCLRRNAASSNEEIRCRLDTIGEFHFGEMCNKFMSGSLVMPVSAKNTSSSRRQIRRVGAPQKMPSTGISSPLSKIAAQIHLPVVSVGSQTLFGTVDGTLGAILGLDSRTAAFFATLERAMASVIHHVGDFSHQHFRACHAERRIHPAHGFVDGDLVESFLDLDRDIMDAIVEEMNREGGWDVEDNTLQNQGGKTRGQVDSVNETEINRFTLSVDDVLAMVEEMTMLH